MSNYWWICLILATCYQSSLFALLRIVTKEKEKVSCCSSTPTINISTTQCSLSNKTIQALLHEHEESAAQSPFTIVRVMVQNQEGTQLNYYNVKTLTHIPNAEKQNTTLPEFYTLSPNKKTFIFDPVQTYGYEIHLKSQRKESICSCCSPPLVAIVKVLAAWPLQWWRIKWN